MGSMMGMTYGGGGGTLGPGMVFGFYAGRHAAHRGLELRQHAALAHGHDEVLRLAAFEGLPVERAREVHGDAIGVARRAARRDKARALLAQARLRKPLSEIRLPLHDGRLLAEIHREAEVLEQRHEGEELVLTARLGESLAGKLRRAGAGVTARD